MRTRKYKTLKGLNAQTTQLTYREIMTGRFHHLQTGWGKFKLDEAEKEKALDQVVASIGGRYPNKVRSVLKYQIPRHWALDRFIYSKHSHRFMYYAGQDMTWEMNDLRNYLYKLY